MLFVFDWEDIDSLKVFASPTFLYDKTVFDIDSNGHIALSMLFGGFPKKYTFISTSSTEGMDCLFLF